MQERNITPNIYMTENKVIREVNKAALSRIFSNLINNATKYSDGDLYIMLTDLGEITFSNTASDLSEVEVERLFDCFYTVNTARNSTGLGLAIAKMLTEKMGGVISVGLKNEVLTVSVKIPQGIIIK